MQTHEVDDFAGMGAHPFERTRETLLGQTDLELDRVRIDTRCREPAVVIVRSPASQVVECALAEAGRQIDVPLRAGR